MARITPVSAVGSDSVCERVAREKSSNRSRRVTVRQTRRPLRSRRQIRSTRPTSTASIASGRNRFQPVAHWPPTERRRTPVRTRRGSRLWASACSWRPAARPTSETSISSSSRATSPTVISPCAFSFPAVTGPTPHSRSTGSGCRNASSVPAGTTSSPSGLATALATLARNFVTATPTVIGSPTSSRTRRRSRSAICSGEPAIRRMPRTSRNASSIDRPSTSGVVSRNTSNTALLASEYAENRGLTTTASGHSCRARRPPMAVRTPRALAS